MEDFRPLESLGGLERYRPGLYALWGADDELLYIGQSNSIIGRQAAHRKRKWGADIRKITALPGIESASDRLIAEAVLLLRHFPRYNKAVKLALSPTKRSVAEIQFIRGKPNPKRKDV